MPGLFDMDLRALRRDRAARLGPEMFLLERAFDDCLDRLALMRRRFESALLIGCPSREWPERLHEFAKMIDVRDPGPLFAQAASGDVVVEDAWEPARHAYDVAVAVGTLDTVDDLPRALLTVRWALGEDALFLGAMSGGETIPRLRAAMRAADLASGIAAPHVHPRIEASALAPLLSSAGFAEPVVDVDRVPVSYRSLHHLVGDLRRMGATNVLSERPRVSLLKRDYAAAAEEFSRAGDDARTIETFEILHFACWAPAG